jgi:C4-dicarboxylate-specific signal transduction histidine kinase
VTNSLGKLVNMTNRIAKIIRGLRSFSRDGTTDPFLKNQLNVIIDDTFELIRGRCKDNGVKLRIYPEQYRHELDCRAVQISQVIANLVGNSVDAIRNLPERWIDISVDKEPESLLIRITDSGAGISPELAEKIFNPFFTTKKVGEGTGLGLSISKGIIQAHSGQFYINRECLNTQFVIELPIRQLLEKTEQFANASDRKNAQSA